MSGPIPIACTLPLAQGPDRLDEWRTLFATTVLAVDRDTPRHVRMTLDARRTDEAATRDLMARETACCAFFDFALTRIDDATFALDMRVPEDAEDVLATMARQADVAAGLVR
jgi:hypothetical protein